MVPSIFFVILHRMDKMRAKLAERTAQGNLRNLVRGQGRIDFFSNDYLGLARSAELSRNISQAYAKFDGKINGSAGSRLLAGHNVFFEELEVFLAGIFLAEKALVFNSGYNANLAILSCVPQRGDTILYDELIHASLIDGARLSFARRHSFAHNDLNDLRRLLQKSEGDVYVVIESVYSMDGDCAPLREILDLCETFGANLIVDEAHSTGVYGDKGSGMVCMLGLQNRVFARVMTFGKAMGVHGACVCGSSVLIDYLINFARSFIYTTALPVHSLVSIDQSFRFLARYEILQSQLREKIHIFLKLTEELRLGTVLIPSQSSVQMLKVPGNTNAKKLATHLMDAGFDVRAILSPTVKEGEERLRICIHSFNTSEDIYRLVKETASVI